MAASTSKRRWNDDSTDKKAKVMKLADNTKCKEKLLTPLWKDHDLLASTANIDVNIAKATIHLLDDGNTIPFIARYRKHVTGDMSPEQLREIKTAYNSICTIKEKIITVGKAIQKLGLYDSKVHAALCNAKSMEVVEHIYAPFKPTKKRTLANRAKELGLEDAGLAILEQKTVNLQSLVQPTGPEGLQNIEEVLEGIKHIIAHVISTDTDVLTFIRDLCTNLHVLVETKKAKGTAASAKIQAAKNVRERDVDKFSMYFQFTVPVKYIKPHQTLAINRGEDLKILSVKVLYPEKTQYRFQNFCTNRWRIDKHPQAHKQLMNSSVDDAFTRILTPLMTREIRGELTVQAEKASHEVFSRNLKQLFMGAPVKGQPILAIDPGFNKGCKIAIVSETGTLLDSAVVYPHTNNKRAHNDAEILQKMLLKHRCSLIALGNGTACRETESWLSDLIKNGTFAPLEVAFTIVNESGASVYSCSPEAKKEFPDLDVNIISAVSLARRLQNPLAELVKVEPFHLGVGMYQHDLNRKALNETLDETVSECVSFIGIDINTTSQCLLRRVAGLGDKRATHIIDYRDKNGPFINRTDLKKVRSVGEKIFNQCAGFIRVGPCNADEAIEFYSQPQTNRLDSTWIHPESYNLTTRLINKFGLSIKDLGSTEFMKTVASCEAKHSVDDLSNEFKCEATDVRLIMDAFSRPLAHDLRNDLPIEPLFQTSVRKFTDLKSGIVLSGIINNCTHFGSFVDVGVGVNGLIHTSCMKGYVLNVGDRVEVTVKNVEVTRERIQLELNRIL